MEVSVETTSALSRKMTVQLPEDTVSEKVDLRLKNLGKDMRLDGFRPGKVPPGVIRKRFGGAVRNEVVNELIQSSLGEALKKEGFQIAGGLEFETPQAEEGQGLRYVANFEVYPAIELNPVEDLAVTHYSSEVSSEDVDNMIERLREQRKEWVTVDRAAVPGDKVTINFQGKADGEEFTDGVVEGFDVELGSSQMIPGFEDKLIGAENGAHLQFELEFPAEYGSPKLAGKTAGFEVDVIQVAESSLPEVNEEFIKSHGKGDGDYQTFRDVVKNNMEREMKRSLRAKVKTGVMDAVYAANPVGLPKAMVEQEIDRIQAPIKEAFEKQNTAFPKDLPRDDYREQAEKRVALGLLLAEIIKKTQIQVDKDRVTSTIEVMAASYENPQEMIDWYHSNPEQLKQVEQMVLEDQVVDWVLERARATDEAIRFDDLMNPSQKPGEERE